MSRTVCSWCKAPLVLKDDILVCSNTDCSACDEKYLHEELIRTRKALDVAIERLSLIARETFQGEPSSINMGFHVRAEAALADIDEITALEQKDVK